MKFILTFLSIAVMTALASLILPWWAGSVLAFGIILVAGLTPSQSFFAGLLGVGLAWCILAVRADMQNGHLLSTRIGELFMGISPFSVVLTATVIGALSGGLGGWTAGLLRKQWKG